MSVIKGEDVIVKNHLAEPIAQSEKYLESLIKIDKAIIKIGKDSKKALTKNKGETAKDFQEINTALKQSEELKKQQVQVNNAVVKSQQNLSKAYQTENKQIQRNKLLTNERNKAVKQQVQLDKAASGSIAQMRIKLSQLTKTFDGLSRAERENAKIGGVLFNQIKRVRTEVGKLEAATGRSQRAVGNYGTALKGAANSARNLVSALGVVGGIQLFTRVIRDAFNIVKDFDAAQANLAAISGLTAEQLRPLTEQAKQLGATTAFTAGQVSQLQLELAKLGFRPEEIEASAEAILNLSAALGADLGEAAALTGSALKAFGLDASEAGRVTDVLVKAANNAAVDFQFFNAALSTVAPVANAVGVDIEKTAALLGTLANAGLDASTSATGLRNIFLALTESGQSLPAALDQIKNSTNQAKTALDLFGKRGASLGVVLANNQEGAAELEKSLRDAGGTAEEVANKQLASLDGQLKILRSAWEGFILGAEESGGAADKLKNIVKFLSKNLDTILSTIITVAKAFIVYKGAIILSRLATVGYSVATKAAAIATQIFSGNVKRAGVEMRKFGAITKVNPFALIATALLVVLPLIFKFFDGIGKAGKGIEQLSRAETALQSVQKKTAARLEEERGQLDLVFESLKATTAGTEERQEALDRVNEKYGLTLQNLEDEAAFVRQVDAAYRDLVDTLEAKITTEIIGEELKILFKELRNARKEAERLGLDDLELDEDVIPGLEGIADAVGDVDSSLDGLNDTAQETTDQLIFKNARNNIESIKDAIEALQRELLGVSGSADIFGASVLEGTEAATKATKKKFKILAELNRQLFKDVQATNRQNMIAFERDLIRQGKSEEEIRERLGERRLLNLANETRLALRLFGDGGQEFLKVDLQFLKELDKQESDAAKRRAQILRDELAEQKRIQKERQLLFSDVQENADENLKILEANLIEEGKSLQDIQDAIDEEKLRGLRQTAESAREIFGENSKQFIDANLELQREIQRQNEVAKKEQEKAISDLKKSAQDTIKIFQEITKGLEENIDRRIAARQKEISQGQGRIEQLQELAAQGNLEASQSIKAEEAKQDILEKQIQELERKRRNLLIINTALLAAQQGLEAGDKNAFANASSDVSSFISGLPKFKEGTENTGKGGSLDKDGGFLSMLHPGERVLSAEQNAPLLSKGIGNEDLSSLAMAGHDAMMMKQASKNTQPFQDIATLMMLNGLVDGQAEQTKILNGLPARMPKTRFEFDEQRKMFVEIIKTDNEIIRFIRNIRK